MAQSGFAVSVVSMIPKLLCRLAVVAVFFAVSAFAQEIKVDFNFNNKPPSQTWDPLYTPWNTNANGIWFPSGANSLTNTFSGVTFIFTRVGPTGTGLTTDWYQAGLPTAKLVNDGITVAPFNQTNIVGTSTAAGARIEVTISNLSAGSHTLLTWHNTWQNPSAYSFSPLNLYLNGSQIITNLPVSNRVTNNADAAYSYVKFNSDGTNNTVITYEASTNFTVNVCNVSIDGFELDTPDFKFKANKPSPLHNDEHVDADATRNVLLSWTKAALGVFSKQVSSTLPLAFQLQGYPFNRIIFNAVISRVGQVVAGESQPDEAYKRIEADITQQIAERKK